MRECAPHSCQCHNCTTGYSVSISHCRIQFKFTLFWQFHWKSLESSAATLSLGGVSPLLYKLTRLTLSATSATRAQKTSWSSVKERRDFTFHCAPHQCGPTLGAKVCHQYFLILISTAGCPPVSC